MTTNPKRSRKTKKDRFVSIVSARFLILDRVEVYNSEITMMINQIKSVCKLDGNGKENYSKSMQYFTREISNKGDSIRDLLVILQQLEAEAQ